MGDAEELKKIKQQHINNYKMAVLEIVKNNTDVLVDEDISSLFKKPPLDSMDLIKTEFLSLAKKNKIVLNIDELNKILDNYRKCLLKCCDDIKKIRVNKLSNKINHTEFIKNNDIIKFNKKDFSSIDKEIKKIIKNQATIASEKYIIKKMDKIFLDGVDEDKKSKISLDFTKWMKGHYKNQLFENVDIKIMVKDTTLMNSCKEQASRYLFTLNNSRLLNNFND